MSNTTSCQKLLLTEAETAKLLNVSRRSLTEWRRLRRGPSFCDLSQGKCKRPTIRYKLSDVLKWLDETHINTEAS